MTQELPQRDGRGVVEGDHDVELRTVGLDRRVEVDLALLDLLHDGQGVEELGDRAGAEDAVALYAAEPGRVDDLLVIHQGHGHSVQLVLGQFLADGLFQLGDRLGIIGRFVRRVGRGACFRQIVHGDDGEEE